MREDERALFNTETTLEVDTALVDELVRRARHADQGCFRLCLHHSPTDSVQEMIIASTPRHYCRPHRHPTAAMTVYILRGELFLILFHDCGQVSRVIELVPPGGDKPFCARLERNVWHTVVPVMESAFLEVTSGPYVKESCNVYADWSPEEGSSAVAEYMNRLRAHRGRA
jgi:glucose-6-phosphate isomerase